MSVIRVSRATDKQSTENQSMAKGGKRHGAGRPKGSQNKTTVFAKAAIEGAFAHLQRKTAERKDLESWAEDNTDDFYKLLFPKLLPVQLNHGDNEGEKLDGFKVILVGKSS